MKKYEFTEEVIVVDGHTLHRIRALKDFGDVKAGDLGGFVESEDNLSHEGNCWIYDHAMIYGGARVFGNAKVYEYALVYNNAKVYGNAKVFGFAQVFCDAKVYEKAQVFDSAKVFGEVSVRDKASVSGEIELDGHKTIDNVNVQNGGDTIEKQVDQLNEEKCECDCKNEFDETRAAIAMLTTSLIYLLDKVGFSLDDYIKELQQASAEVKKGNAK